MKKNIAILLVFCLCIGLCACGNSSSFTIAELQNALLSEEIEFGDFVISETDDGYAFLSESNELNIIGTANKKKNVQYIMFINIGLDVSVFDNNKVFEEWYKSVSGDISGMTYGALERAMVAMRCLSELEAFAQFTGKTEDSYLFAVNTLLRKESTEMKGWNIQVTVDSDKNALVIEAIGKKSKAEEDVSAKIDAMITEREYNKAISKVDYDPEAAYTFFQDHKDYKDSAEYLENFKHILSVKKTNTSSTTYTYENGLLVKDVTTYTTYADLMEETMEYKYTDSGLLTETVYKTKTKFTGPKTIVTMYNDHGNAVRMEMYIGRELYEETSYENAYYPDGKILSIRTETTNARDEKEIKSISTSSYTENGDVTVDYEISANGMIKQIFKYDEQGNLIYRESQYADKAPVIDTFEYKYEYNGDGLLAYSCQVMQNGELVDETWYEYTVAYQE